MGLAEPTESVVQGYIGFSHPIEGAWIAAYFIDSETGERDLTQDVFTATSAPDGTFTFTVPDRLFDTLKVTASGGTTMEYWSPGPLQLRGRIHSAAIIPYWRASRARNVVITPWTTLSMKLGESWHVNGKEPFYAESAMEANRLMHAHVIGPPLFEKEDDAWWRCASDLTCMRPTDIANDEHLHEVDNPANNESVLYAVSLFSLSALSIQRHRQNDSFDDNGCGTELTVMDLAKDVGDNGLFDGNTEARTTVETLRAEFIDAAARDYWNSEHNQSPITMGELGRQFCRIVHNHETELFGSTAPAGLDWLCTDSSILRR